MRILKSRANDREAFQEPGRQSGRFIFILISHQPGTGWPLHQQGSGSAPSALQFPDSPRRSPHVGGDDVLVEGEVTARLRELGQVWGMMRLSNAAAIARD